MGKKHKALARLSGAFLDMLSVAGANHTDLCEARKEIEGHEDKIERLGQLHMNALDDNAKLLEKIKEAFGVIDQLKSQLRESETTPDRFMEDEIKQLEAKLSSSDIEANGRLDVIKALNKHINDLELKLKNARI